MRFSAILRTMRLLGFTAAVTIKGPATPVGAFYDFGGDSIGTTRIAVRKKLVNKSDSFSLELTLKELQIDGDILPLAEQTVLMEDTTLVTIDGPKKRAVVDVDWDVDPIETASDVLVCVQVLKHNHGTTKPKGRVDCEELTPVL